MKHWFSGGRQTTRKRRGRALGLERLEARDCPAAPQLLDFSVVPANNDNTVVVSGVVQDDNPQATTVAISGVVTGSVTPNAAGFFSFDSTTSSLGTVTAQATDQAGLSSPVAETELTSPVPTVLMSLDQVQGTTVTVSGVVGDLDPGASWVTFSGALSGSVPVNGDGSFLFTEGAYDLGAIYVSATDAWGQASNTAEVDLTTPAPTLTLNVTPCGGTMVQVTGQVAGDGPWQWNVSLGGVVNGSVPVNPDGSFIWTGQASGAGAVTASATDVWGQVGTASAAVSYATSVSNLSVTPQPDGSVTVSGQVEADPSNVTVAFSGALSGSVATNPDGTFSYNAMPTGTGTITATTSDPQSQTTPSAEDSAQTVPTLTLNVASNGGQTVTVSGQVSDPDAEDCYVSFSGAISGGTLVNPDGSYSFTTTAGSLGSITAVATNPPGNTGTASANLTQTAPTLTFAVTPDDGNTVTVVGQVSSSNPQGTTVWFTNITSGSATADSDGFFCFTTTVSALGTITATATDPWGQTSGPVAQTFSVAPPALTLAIADVEGNDVTLIGTLCTDTYANQDITITAPGCSANAWTDATGTFQITVSCNQLGEIDASYTDAWGQTGTAAVELTDVVPSLTLNVTRYGNQIVTLSGQLSADSPGNRTVSFSGVAAGSVQTNPDGSFSYTTTISALGTIEANTFDIWSQTCTATATVSGPPPSLSFTVTSNGGQTITITGQVANSLGEPYEVVFSGLIDLTTWTPADGSFSFTTTAPGEGTINATADPIDGGTELTASATVSYATPSLNLSVTPQQDGSVTVFGQVDDPTPGNGTVTFSGSLSGSVATNPDGTFSYNAMPSGSGTITATVSDAQSQTASAAVTLAQTAPTVTLNVTAGSGQSVTVSGRVADLNAGDCIVSFSGAIGGWVRTNPDGTFRYTTGANQLGAIDATVTDDQGQSTTTEADFSDQAPALTFSINPVGGRYVEITGQVVDEDQGDCMVTFSGVIDGVAWTNPDGSFSYTTQASALGAITVTATNTWGLSSDDVTEQLSVPRPTLTLNLTQGGRREITLQGTVSASDPTGCTVMFTGGAAGWATPKANGGFDLVTEGLQLGNITAVASDAWGQLSDPVTVTITNRSPAILNFNAVSVGRFNKWTFSGKVEDDSPIGLRIFLGGLAAVQNVSIKVGCWDGSFNQNITIPPQQAGCVTANMDDWWGVAASEVWTPIKPT